ncbi:thiol:disulfide interchange protein DsbD [Cricetibacter osteomyelitidis]|uniref:Thiol:disulfide interchange protein DsbD n=1 Tax=Cricetibacter osteomyelitidis TaxID=1521931 RepID=A0A4R2T7H5_9PAST|nr:protein-disulfide reductase DsbD [Cricetibacter osteomyelitidis]TCP96804.1 thiol:disulfide interchange protein DsbD [Cricetibacter osteomyelitidis]
MRKLYSFIFLFLIFFSLNLHAGLFDNNKSKYLRSEQAFVFSAQQQSQQMTLHWQIADGYYLYKKEINIKPLNAEIGNIVFPVAEQYHDEFFGNVEIFRHELNIDVPLTQIARNALLEITYQGCTKGFCYPPETQRITLKSAVENAEISANSTALSEQDRLAQGLVQNKTSMFWFFLLGLGLAFTPCVLPMLPLLSAIVIGQNRGNTIRAFGLSFTYVQGMAVTYTAMGLIVSAVGLPFQVALQSPAVLITLSVIFVLLALSMFGLFELQLPSSLQTKLTAWSQKQQSGAYGGVFAMGMIAGLIASPCITAPLSGVLLYVAQTGDMLTGGLTLYLLALGMGVPLMLITLFGNKVLPKSGDWLNAVKTAFGFVMLALPVFLISRLWPEWEWRLWSLLSVSFLIWLALQFKQGWFARVVQVILLVAAIIIAKPLQDWIWQPTVTPQSAVENYNNFQAITTYEELQQVLADNPKSFVMLDLYADWCVACKEFEKYTFSDRNVQQAFANLLLLRVDMTKNSESNRTLMTQLNVIGLPTIIFFDQQGKEISGSRVTGFMPPESFLDWLTNIGIINK